MHLTARSQVLRSVHASHQPRRHLQRIRGQAAGDQQAPGPVHKVGTMNKLLQNVNTAGTSLFFRIAWAEQHLAVPHLSVPDIGWVDWRALKAAGFKACIFDKDNTLSRPFVLSVHPSLQPSLEVCRQVFGSNLVLYSNSAGLEQYDPQGEEAAALEAALGIPVLRHRDKKPAGGCAELEQLFGCRASEMIFIGDRYLTDVVFGNRHGMLTIRVAPLTRQGEPVGVLLARLVEQACVSRWTAAGVKAPSNAAFSGAPAGACAFVRQPVSGAT